VVNLDFGDVFAFDAQSGKSIWNTTIGGYGGKTLLTIELTFQAPRGSRGVMRPDEAIPDFSVADGRVFVSFSGAAAYNAITGGLFFLATPG
jgi:outer membrane protein assembly factor BamB